MLQSERNPLLNSAAFAAVCGRFQDTVLEDRRRDTVPRAAAHAACGRRVCVRDPKDEHPTTLCPVHVQVRADHRCLPRIRTGVGGESPLDVCVR